MLFKKFKFNLDKHIYENKSFRIITVVLAAVIVFQTFIIVNKANNERIIFLPPKVASKEFSIVGNELSKAYLEEVASFIAFNLFNVTKEIANNNALNILALVQSDKYYETKNVLTEQFNYIRKNNVSRTIFINQINVSSKNLIVVSGVLKSFIGNKIVENQLVDLYINYEVDNARFFITNLKANIKEDKKGE